jgi:hypothetical protein
LNESACRLGEPARENWWAERGSVRKIDTEEGLEKAVIYVNEAQDRQPTSRR